MVGLYVLGGLIVVGIGVLIVYKVKWGRASKAEARRRQEKIDEERSKK